MNRRVHPLVLALAVTGWASSAHAQSVRLSDTPCARALPEAALARMLEIELFGDGVRGVGDVPDGEAHAVVELASTCTEPMVVSVTTRDRLTGASLGREVELGGVPASLRVRTLALSVAELLRATWYLPVTLAPARASLPATSQLGAPRRAPRVSAALGEEPERRDDGNLAWLFRSPAEAPWRPLAAGIEAVGRWFPATGLGVLGGRALIAVDTGTSSGLTLDAGILGGPPLPGDGVDEVLLVPVGVSWTAQLTAGGVRAAIGPRIEGGAAMVRWGSQGQTGWGAYLLATATGSVRARLAEGAHLALSADLGWTLAGPELEGLAASPVAGPTVSLAVALLAAP